jgi:branched-chain amino acid transport system ATP-binding protein
MIFVLHRARDSLWPMFARFATAPESRASRAGFDDAPPLPRRTLPPRGTPLLEVTDAVKKFGGLIANDRMSLSVAAGEILALVGPHGAGKTTLLSAIIGVLPFQRSDIVFAGESVRGQCEIERMVAHGMTLVPEKRELFGAKIVEDYLLLDAFMRRGMGFRDERQTLDQLYGLLPHLKERRLQPGGTLSGGERQMLALGRALMTQPRLLMLEEPSLGLAPLIVRVIFHIITNLRALGVAILLVEQNARAALHIADVGYVLETGEIALAGSADQLEDDPRVIESFLGLGKT